MEEKKLNKLLLRESEEDYRAEHLVELWGRLEVVRARPESRYGRKLTEEVDLLSPEAYHCAHLTNLSMLSDVPVKYSRIGVSIWCEDRELLERVIDGVELEMMLSNQHMGSNPLRDFFKYAPLVNTENLRRYHSLTYYPHRLGEMTIRDFCLEVFEKYEKRRSRVHTVCHLQHRVGQNMQLFLHINKEVVGELQELDDSRPEQNWRRRQILDLRVHLLGRMKIDSRRTFGPEPTRAEKE